MDVRVEVCGIVARVDMRGLMRTRPVVQLVHGVVEQMDVGEQERVCALDRVVEVRDARGEMRVLHANEIVPRVRELGGLFVQAADRARTVLDEVIARRRARAGDDRDGRVGRVVPLLEHRLEPLAFLEAPDEEAPA